MESDYLLKPQIISKFASDGVVLLKGLINESWQSLLKVAIEDDIKNPSHHHHAYNKKHHLILIHYIKG